MSHMEYNTDKDQRCKPDSDMLQKLLWDKVGSNISKVRCGQHPEDAGSTVACEVGMGTIVGSKQAEQGREEPRLPLPLPLQAPPTAPSAQIHL